MRGISRVMQLPDNFCFFPNKNERMSFHYFCKKKKKNLDLIRYMAMNHECWLTRFDQRQVVRNLWRIYLTAMVVNLALNSTDPKF